MKMFDLPFLQFILSLIINHNTINSFSLSTNQKYFEFLAAFPILCKRTADRLAVRLETGYKMTWSFGVIMILPRELRRENFREMGHFFDDLIVKIYDKLLNQT